MKGYSEEMQKSDHFDRLSGMFCFSLVLRENPIAVPLKSKQISLKISNGVFLCGLLISLYC